MVLTADFLLVAFGGLETSSFLHPQSIVGGVPTCSIGKKKYIYIYIYKTALASPPEQASAVTNAIVNSPQSYVPD